MTKHKLTKKQFILLTTRGYYIGLLLVCVVSGWLVFSRFTNIFVIGKYTIMDVILFIIGLILVRSFLFRGKTSKFIEQRLKKYPHLYTDE